MRLLRLAARILGWLLTPFVAWAGAHVGGMLGAFLTSPINNPRVGIVLTVLMAAAVGFGGLIFWLRLLRRSPELQRVLHVAEDATPDTSDLIGEE
jgi:hypothetical protein